MDYLFKEKTQIDFMKIDIEGSELKLWYGSQELRKNNPKMIILMEFNRVRYQNPELFIKDLFSEGYEVLKIGEGQNKKIGRAHV